LPRNTTIQLTPPDFVNSFSIAFSALH